MADNAKGSGDINSIVLADGKKSSDVFGIFDPTSYFARDPISGTNNPDNGALGTAMQAYKSKIDEYNKKFLDEKRRVDQYGSDRDAFVQEAMAQPGRQATILTDKGFDFSKDPAKGSSVL
jgi:hypothetical protein